MFERHANTVLQFVIVPHGFMRICYGMAYSGQLGVKTFLV